LSAIKRKLNRARSDWIVADLDRSCKLYVEHSAWKIWE